MNLTSIYTTPVLEKVILTNKNGFSSPTHTPSPTKSDQKLPGHGANTSFLYSHLLSPPKVGSPSKEMDGNGFQNTVIYANLQKECSSNAVNQHLAGSTLNKVSFTGGMNKISDNYEKTLNISPRDVSSMNTLGIFHKDSNFRGKPYQYGDDEDEGDYARDSDECSI